MTSEAQSGLGTLLATAAPEVSLAEAETIARDIFGISGTARPLSGERDSNFHLSASNGAFVLKFSHPAEDALITNFQNQALLHIAARDATLPVPHVWRSLAGQTEWLFERADEAPRVVRVLTYLDGVPFSAASATRGQRRNLGTVLARLDLAMAGFSHPSAHYELMWDIKHALNLRNLLEHIEDPAERALAKHFLDNFATHVQPAMAGLRAQVIHNDMNPHNILLDSADPDQIAGIIDFGDMVHAPLINNLAVASAYLTSEDGHPMQAMGDVIAAYHQVLPLERAELDLLYDLVATRLVLIVAISGWRAARYPENRDYILRNNRRAWTGLSRLRELPRQAAQDWLRQLCEKG